jgi:chemosensory pili system protein ChpA (sensor histidine kinase/response regulator)
VGNRSRRHSVLVVDDDASVRSFYADALRESGHRVAIAVDGADALTRLRDGTHPCVVLTDMRMPRMDGFELSRAAAHDPQLAAIPIVVLTGDKVLALTSPAGDKPFAPAELESLVQRSCRLHRTSFDDAASPG